MMMTWAVIPVKPLHKGKSRLRQVLNPKILYTFNQQLLFHCLDLVVKVKQFDCILVVSRDLKVLEIARERGLSTLFEKPPRRLNAAISQAQDYIRGAGGGSMMVFPVDLTQASIEDLELLLREADTRPCGLVVPDRHQQGTNAIYLDPADLIEPQFGCNSFQKHCGSILEKEAVLKVVINRRMMQDLDTEADLYLSHFFENFAQLISFETEKEMTHV